MDISVVLALGGPFVLATLPLVAVLRSAPPMIDDDERKETGTMMNPFDIFAKGRAGVNLSPGQRAFLKLVQGFLLAGVQSLLLALPTVLALKENQPVLSAVGIGAMLGAFVHGFMAAWQKYSSAKGDAPLAAAIGSVDAAAQHEIGQRFGVPAAKVEPPVVTPASYFTITNTSGMIGYELQPDGSYRQRRLVL